MPNIIRPVFVQDLKKILKHWKSFRTSICAGLFDDFGFGAAHVDFEQSTWISSSSRGF